jgi:hypothetical protein
MIRASSVTRAAAPSSPNTLASPTAEHARDARRLIFILLVGLSYCELSDSADVGITLGAGRRLTYGSIHDRGWSADASVSLGGLSGHAKYSGFSAPGSSPAYFYAGRVQCDRLGKWAPFIAGYAWNDPGGDFGRCRSAVYGVTVRVADFLEVETAVASTSNGRVPWLQFHWTGDR